jgi:hypothetical protein
LRSGHFCRFFFKMGFFGLLPFFSFPSLGSPQFRHSDALPPLRLAPHVSAYFLTAPEAECIIAFEDHCVAITTPFSDTPW